MFSLKGYNWLYFDQFCALCRVNLQTKTQGDQVLRLCSGCYADIPRNPFPCPNCAMPRSNPSDLCTECLGQDHAWDGIDAALSYRFPTNRLMMRVKQGRDPGPLRWLTQLMLKDIPSFLSTCEDPVFVPIPMHPADQIERGFNQTALISSIIANALGAEVARSILQKTRRTPHQLGLNLLERQHNLDGSFRVKYLPDRPIILIDDVMTTGATLDVAATALKNAGASRVYAWVLCRTP